MEDRYEWEVPEGFDAFSYARFYVDKVLLPDIGVIAENREWLGPNLEFDWFRPSLEIQIAGLCLMAGRMGKENFAVALTCSAIDLLIIGWNTTLVSFPRVAYTLCRNVVESAIFSVADAHCRAEFRKIWQDDKATGGKVLHMLSKRQLPEALLEELQRCWKFVVSYGHVSPIPTTMSAGAGTQVPGTSIIAHVLGGPQNGKLPEGLLFHLGGMLAMIAEANLSTFAFTFGERLSENSDWSAKYSEHRRRIEERLLKGKQRPTNAEPSAAPDGNSTALHFHR
ncbi:MAG: hypothetical protein NT106_15135 [Candidatus Sumerlaeota bacterium]|nr:hypothetical protein [Candidatus Sumerlaeota bacterium]